MSANERTEKPTSRHRQRTRDKGSFAYSQQVTGAFTLVFSAAALYYFFQTPAGFKTLLENSLASIAHPGANDVDAIAIVRAGGQYFLLVIAPVLGAAMLGSLVGSFAQGLPVFAKDALLKWERLNPVQGFSQLKMRVSWIEWARLIAVLIIVSVVLWQTVSAYWEPMLRSSGASIRDSSEILRSILWSALGYILLSLAVLASVDYFVERWRFEKSIRQSKADVKEDMKSLEGNPTIRGKIRSIQRDRARQRMMERVKDADVIVTNPTHYAVALEYKPDRMNAPRVLAKGMNLIAERIKEIGREHDIPTVENVPLARALYRSVEVEQEIPPELYKAVAEVLAYVFRARRRLLGGPDKG